MYNNRVNSTKLRSVIWFTFQFHMQWRTIFLPNVYMPPICPAVGMSWVVLLLRNDASHLLKLKVAPTLDFSISLHQVYRHFGYQIFVAFQKWYALLYFLQQLIWVLFMSFSMCSLLFILDRSLNALIWERFLLILLDKKMIRQILLQWWKIWGAAVQG